MKSDGRISVAEVVACVEQMDFIVDEPLEDLVRSVVPAAIEVDRLSLNDAIKVSARLLCLRKLKPRYAGVNTTHVGVVSACECECE